MPDQQIEELAELLALATGDLLVIADVSDLTDDAGGTTKKVSVATLQAFVLANETDPVFAASEAAGITATDTGNWDTAFSWGDHAAAGYASAGHSHAVFSQDTDGFSPGPTAADITSNRVLQADGAWVDQSGGGTSGAAGELLTDDGAGGITSNSDLTWDGTNLVVDTLGGTDSLQIKRQGVERFYVDTNSSESTAVRIIDESSPGSRFTHITPGGLNLRAGGSALIHLDKGSPTADHGFLCKSQNVEYARFGLGQSTNVFTAKTVRGASIVFNSDENTTFDRRGVEWLRSNSTLDTIIGGLLRRHCDAGLTASTTQTQGNGALVADINEVATVANPNDVVTLPDAIAGRKIVVINNGGSPLQVFPASGDDLGAGVDASTSIAAGSHAEFIAYDSTNWLEV